LLLPWGWGPQERFQRKYKDSDNTNVPEVPLWDTTIANTNAVKITVRA